MVTPSSHARGETLPMTVYQPNAVIEAEYRPTNHDYEMMGIAIDLAEEAKNEGDSPIGAVLETPEGMFKGSTREFRDQDLEAHAEKLVYQQAREKIGRDLGKCVLYTTAEPCLGCAYMLDKGRIGMLFVAASRPEGNGFFRRPDTLHQVWSSSRRTLTVVRGLLEIRAAELLTTDARKH